MILRTRKVKKEFVFTDSIENIEDSRYYRWLLKTNIKDIIQGVKKQYLEYYGYDKYGSKNRISEEQFTALLKIEQKYYDDFVRQGCERFWSPEFRKKFKHKVAEIEKRLAYQRFN